MCKAIDDPALGNDTFAKLYHAASIYYNYTGSSKCFDLNDNSDPHGLAEWNWQVPHILALFPVLSSCSFDSNPEAIIAGLHRDDHAHRWKQ